MSAHETIGILLAAGKGVRFDPSGRHNKLLQPLADGSLVAERSARSLLAAMDMVLAVVRDADSELAHVLLQAGCSIVPCPLSGQGMGASLVCGMRAAPIAGVYLIALADMPHVQAETFKALVAAIGNGADIAVPVHAGRRGNPVAFSTAHRLRLLELGGDEGARRLLRQHPVQEIPVADAGIHQDIDHPDDL